jgi:uncharacterized membrane protein YhaH (DUF805 family)
MTLLSFHGRSGRVRYLLESLGPYVVLIALVIAMIALAPRSQITQWRGQSTVSSSETSSMMADIAAHRDVHYSGVTVKLDEPPHRAEPAPGFWAAVIAFVLGCFLGVWIEIAAQVRRLHDLGQSGWLAALNLVPGVSPLMWLVLVLAPGQPHDNVYGGKS